MEESFNYFIVKYFDIKENLLFLLLNFLDFDEVLLFTVT